MVSILEGRMPQFGELYDGQKQRTLVESLERRFLRINNALALKQFNFRARRTTAQIDIVTATPTVVSYSTEDWDADNVYDNVTFRYAPTVAGYYNISAGGVVTSLADASYALLSIRKNGTDEYIGLKYYNNTGGAADTAAIVSGVVSLNGVDYIDITIEHNNGSDRDISASSTQNFFSAYRVG